MNLKTYVNNLKVLLKEHPEMSGYEAVYAIDDEGNAHHGVNFEPTPGFYEDGEFSTPQEEDEFFPLNAVCIN